MAAAFFAAMSCNVFDDAEYADIRELAPSQGEILIPKEGGKADIKVYSNGKVTVNVLATSPENGLKSRLWNSKATVR